MGHVRTILEGQIKSSCIHRLLIVAPSPPALRSTHLAPNQRAKAVMVEPWEKFYEAIRKLKSSDSSEVTE